MHKKYRHFRASEVLVNATAQAAKKRGMSVSEYIRWAIAQDLARLGIDLQATEG
jgi:predicted DNA binding CopG/RHH family protein